MIPFRFRNQVNWTGHAARSASWRFHTGVRRTRQIAKLCPPTAFTRAAVHTVCRRLLDGNKWQWCWCIHNTLLHPSWYGRMGCIVSGFTFSCLNAWWFWSAAVTSIAFRLDRSPALTSNQAAKKLFYIRIHSVPFFSAIEPLDIATFRKEMDLFFFIWICNKSGPSKTLCCKRYSTLYNHGSYVGCRSSDIIIIIMFAFDNWCDIYGGLLHYAAESYDMERWSQISITSF